MSRIILYIATSLDGYIAKKDGSIDFLDPQNESGEDYGYNKFYASVGAVVMGNTTYKQVGNTKEFEEYYKGKPVFVFTRSPKSKKKNVTFISEDVKDFVKRIESDIWLVGGAKLNSSFMDAGLIDEIILSIIPITLGDGIPLFRGLKKDIKLELLKTTSYPDLMQLHYKVVKE